MTDRDRLAADLAAAWPLGNPEMLMEPIGGGKWQETPLADYLADRLIALGWTLRDGAYVGTVEPVIEWEIDEERLARALVAAGVCERLVAPDTYSSSSALYYADVTAAAIAKAYREDTGP